MSRKLITLAVVIVMALCMTACGKKTIPEKISDAVKSTGESIDDAAKATGKAIDDAAKRKD